MSAWEILGVPEGCDYEELRRQFRRKALQHHPDKLGQVNVDALKATAEFQSLLKAYEILKLKLENNDDSDGLLEQCRRQSKDALNRILLCQTQQLDADLYCFTCRCGYDIPIELDVLSQFEVSLLPQDLSQFQHLFSELHINRLRWMFSCVPSRFEELIIQLPTFEELIIQLPTLDDRSVL